MEENKLGTAYGWDSTISNEDSAFAVLPEGTYEFEVKSMARGEFPGSEKMSRCYKADLTLQVTNPVDGTTGTVFDTLYLNSKAEWRLSQFFLSIGQKKHGEPLKMNWSKVEGAKGRLELSINKYTTRDGDERTNNRVTKYLDPVQQKKWTPGQGF